MIGKFPFLFRGPLRLVLRSLRACETFSIRLLFLNQAFHKKLSSRVKHSMRSVERLIEREDLIYRRKLRKIRSFSYPCHCLVLTRSFFYRFRFIEVFQVDFFTFTQTAPINVLRKVVVVLNLVNSFTSKFRLSICNSFECSFEGTISVRGKQT